MSATDGQPADTDVLRHTVPPGTHIDARAQLRTAHDMFDATGMEAFASRAQRATGETVHRRTVEWHLRKISTKLGVGSRRELRAALARLGPDRDPS